MIVYATNQQMHRAAEHGICFYMLIQGVYMITDASAEQLDEAGLSIRAKP